MKAKFDCKSALYIMSDDLLGKLAKESAIKNGKKHGLEVKGYVMVPPNTTDFYPFLTKALKSNPDYLHCKLPPGSVALVIKQSRELGYNGYIAYPNPLPANLEKWQGIAGVEASKNFVGVGVTLEEYSPLGLKYHAFWEKESKSTGSSDLAYPMQPYILMVAIERAQSLNPDEVLKVLRTEEFPSFYKYPLKASGEKTFGIKNHMSVPVPYSVVVGKDQVKYLGSVQGVTP
jgi:ABC-type branched-subunit amino acid transport system substrate-binding protein